jgi:hypothetical protein
VRSTYAGFARSWERRRGERDAVRREAATPAACGAVVLVLALLLLALAACTDEGSGAPRTGPRATTASAPRGAESGSVFALLADNTLVRISLATGRVQDALSLGAPPDRLATGRYLALGEGGKTLFVLVSSGRDGPSELAEVDPATARASDRYALPEGIRFRAVVVGPKSGRLYLLGYRTTEAGRGDAEVAPGQGDAVVAFFDPGRGTPEFHTVREANGRDWSVFGGTVAPDERFLFVSYHGDDTTGVDRLSLTENGVERCRSGNQAGRGCIPGHGDVETYGESILVATGTPRITEIDRGGEVLRSLQTGLEGNHLMRFAVDADGGYLYAVGSCGYSGGLSRLDLETGRANELAPEGFAPTVNNLLCGEGVDIGPDSLVVVAKTERPVPSAEIPGYLLLVNGETGRIIRSVEVPTEPIDTLVVPGPLDGTTSLPAD